MSETQVHARPSRRPITFWVEDALVNRFDVLARDQQRSRAAELRRMMLERVRNDFPERRSGHAGE